MIFLNLFFVFKQDPFFWMALWVTSPTTEEKMDLLSLPPSLSFPVTWKETPAAGWEFLLVPLLPGFPTHLPWTNGKI